MRYCVLGVTIAVLVGWIPAASGEDACQTYVGILNERDKLFTLENQTAAAQAYARGDHSLAREIGDARTAAGFAPIVVLGQEKDDRSSAEEATEADAAVALLSASVSLEDAVSKMHEWMQVTMPDPSKVFDLKMIEAMTETQTKLQEAMEAAARQMVCNDFDSVR